MPYKSFLKGWILSLCLCWAQVPTGMDLGIIFSRTWRLEKCVLCAAGRSGWSWWNYTGITGILSKEEGVRPWSKRNKLSSAKAGGSGVSSGTAECDSCSGCPARGDYTEFSILPKLGNASGWAGVRFQLRATHEISSSGESSLFQQVTKVSPEGLSACDSCGAQPW